MKINLKVIFLSALCLATIASTSVYAEKSETNVKAEPKVLKSEQIKVLDDVVTHRVIEQNGRILNAYSGKVKDKKKAIEEILGTSQNRNSFAPTADECVRTASHDLDNQTGSALNMSEASSCRLETTFTVTLRLNQGGFHGGYWLGEGNADQIVLREKVTFNMTGWQLSVGWPPSFSVAPGNSSGDWTSEPIEDTWLLTTQHVEIKATNLGGTSIDLIDSSDIYVGSIIYRPQVSANHNLRL